jgi:hypothetical protein
MSGAIPCQFTASTSFSRLSTLNPLRFHIFHFRLQSMLPLLLGGCLLFISDSTQAYAQIKTGEVLLAQRVYQDLPPPPNVPLAPYGQEPLPQVPTAEPFSTSPQNSVEFRAPSNQYNQYNQNFGRYQVYVYGSNLRRQLPEVRDIVPDAFIKRLGRRDVIQAGVFRSESGARDRARQLQSRGIGNTRIASNNGQDIPNYPDTGYPNGYPGGNYGGNRSNNYYVVIPTKSEELPYYRNEIRRYVRRRDVPVIPRDEPRGPHVAVGPFAKRWLAEEWNNYLRRDSRFGNARVYYGK